MADKKFSPEYSLLEHCRKIFSLSRGDVTVRENPPDIPYVYGTPVIRCRYISLFDGIG
jgi:hypothetical protein